MRPASTSKGDFVESEGSFDEYVAARWARLVRTVVLLGADVHTAEDVVQDALARCSHRWNRVMRSRDPDGYVHRAVINRFIDTKRRFWLRESPVGQLPDRDVTEDSTDTFVDGDPVRAALLRLPAAQREVVVLRFFLDLTEQQTAHAVDAPVGTVKSRSARALDALSVDTLLIEAVRGDA